MQLYQINIARIWLDFSCFQGYSLYSTFHHSLSWNFFKCFFGHTFWNAKPFKHFILFVRFTFNQLIFYYLILSFCSITSTGLEKVLPRPPWVRTGCLCSPLSFNLISECSFEVVLVQNEQFNTLLYLHFSVIPLLLFPDCLPDLVCAGTWECKWWDSGSAL